MTAKMDKPFYVPANFSTEWIDNFIPYKVEPLMPKNSFLAGFRADRMGQASAYKMYQYLTEKGVIEQKTHNIQKKILQGSDDLERFKSIDPARAWEVREAIIRDLAQDCGSLHKARQLANRHMPLEDKYFKLGHKLHVFDEEDVIQKASLLSLNPSVIIQERFKKDILIRVCSRKEFEQLAQGPNIQRVHVIHSRPIDRTFLDIVDGIEVCTITPRDRKLDVLKEKAAKGDVTAKSQLLSEQVVEMPDKLAELPMHIITPKPNPGLLKKSITKESLKAAAVKAKAVGEQGFKAQISCEQLTINASDVVGGVIGSTAVRYVQGELSANEAAAEVFIESGKGIVANVIANTAGDASRSVLENFIPADKIPGIAPTMRVITVGKAILTAPNMIEAAKKGTDAAANCAIQYGASILVPAVAPTLGTTVGTVVGGAATAFVGVFAAPPVAVAVGAVVGTVATISTVSFVIGGIGSAGIATKNYAITKVWKSA